MKIYILSTYGEYGAETVKATTDARAVVRMFESYARARVPGGYPGQTFGDPRQGELAKLRELLERDEPTPESGANLGDGWGGFQLHIIKAFE